MILRSPFRRTEEVAAAVGFSGFPKLLYITGEVLVHQWRIVFIEISEVEKINQFN